MNHLERTEAQQMFGLFLFCYPLTYLMPCTRKRLAERLSPGTTLTRKVHDESPVLGNTRLDSDRSQR